MLNGIEGMGWDTQSGKILLNPQTDGVCFNWKDPIDPVQNARRNALLLSGCTNLQSTFIKACLPYPVCVLCHRAGLICDPACSKCSNCARRRAPDWWLCHGGHGGKGYLLDPRSSIDSRAGVVNDRGQVFNSVAGASVYDSLYVADGAIIPNAVGVRHLGVVIVSHF